MEKFRVMGFKKAPPFPNHTALAWKAWALDLDHRKEMEDAANIISILESGKSFTREQWNDALRAGVDKEDMIQALLSATFGNLTMESIVESWKFISKSALLIDSVWLDKKYQGRLS